MAAPPRFALVTFDRVFDTGVSQEFATLPELVEIFGRFELREKTQRRVDKEVKRVEEAAAAWSAGEELGFRAYRELSRAAAAAEAAGEDREEAVAQKLSAMRKNAAGTAKKDLHLWSPALYQPDSRRGKDGVLHLSCLVMDYDEGVSIAEAMATWRPWFHMLHTTWSHSPARPRFRLVLPLAKPVLGEDWALVGQWAEERTGHKIDPAGKGKASTFALPAVRSTDAPCFATCQPGELLDLVTEKVVERAAAPSELEFEADDSSIVGGFGGKKYVDAPAVEYAEEDDDDDFEADAFWESFDTKSSAKASVPKSRTPSPAPVAASATPTESAVLEELRELRSLLVGDKRATFIDALERLHALHGEGGLTDEEFRLAKAKLLEPS